MRENTTMSRITKLAAGICGLGVVAVLASPLLAQGPAGQGGPGEPGGRGMRGHGPMRAGIEGLPLRELQLTDAQREQVRGIMTARQADFKAIGDRLHAAQEAQRAAVTRVPIDENEIRARVTEASTAEADFAILRARIHEQVYQVLTPEQQAKAKTLDAERQKRRAERVERSKQRPQETEQKQ
jgi:periplasmic protein CpxP/Spy